MPLTLDDYRYRLHHFGDDKAIFVLSDIDETTSVFYYGFLSIDAYWIIMKKENGSVTYASGQKNYAAYWLIKDELDYNQYDSLEVYSG